MLLLFACLLNAAIALLIWHIAYVRQVNKSLRRIQEANADTLRSLAKIDAAVTHLEAIRAARDLRNR